VKKFLFYAMCAIIVVISACSNDNSANSDANSSLPDKGKTVNEIQLIDMQKYEAIKGENIGKVVIANFYASWCPPCRQEIPGFINSYNKFRSDLEIIGLSLDPDDNAALKFVNEMGINYKVYRADESLQRRFNIMTIPVSVIYKPDGSLYNIHFGYLSEGEIERLVKTLK